MSSLLIPEPWRSFLVDIDGYVKEDHYFHCLGGFVVTHLYGSVRTTSDIDFLTLVGRNNDLIEYAGISSPLYKKFGLYLDPVGVANVPDSYEERLIEMYPGTFKNLRLFALDPYDIVLLNVESQGVPARIPANISADTQLKRLESAEKQRVYDNIVSSNSNIR